MHARKEELTKGLQPFAVGELQGKQRALADCRLLNISYKSAWSLVFS